MNDNWKHRSQGMRCRTCMSFVTKKAIESKLAESLEISDVSLGRCRRHAPTMNGFPVVFSSDWCGDHKIDEEKM